MANQRPPKTRAPRWKRGRRRPTTWHDGNTVGTLAGFPGGAWATLGSPIGGVPAVTTRDILVGEIDALYMDRDEVRIDRIVGDVHFWTPSGASASPSRPPVVRMGIVVTEDPPIQVGTTVYDLFGLTSLSDHEWMYLEQLAPSFENPVAPQEDVGYVNYYYATHLDVRVRRKLGKQDKCILVMQYSNGLEGGLVTNNDWGSPVYHSQLLRALTVN